MYCIGYVHANETNQMDAALLVHRVVSWSAWSIAEWSIPLNRITAFRLYDTDEWHVCAGEPDGCSRRSGLGA